MTLKYESKSSSLISFPSIRITPLVVSYKRSINLIKVVFPAPFSPTIAISSSGLIVMLTFFKAYFSVPGYLKYTFLNSIIGTLLGSSLMGPELIRFLISKRCFT